MEIEIILSFIFIILWTNIINYKLIINNYKHIYINKTNTSILIFSTRYFIKVYFIFIIIYIYIK